MKICENAYFMHCFRLQEIMRRFQGARLEMSYIDAYLLIVLTGDPIYTLPAIITA